ncbi:terminase large subunit [Sphingobium sp. DN12]|uniref:terminase large subunit n=1 Tax=Sphingobium sp. DN12 TaxID=3378073 RepID=UPI003DA21127
MARKFKKDSFAWTALDYAKRVTTGKIPACIQARQACQRFINDLDRDDLTFSEDRADHLCNFAQALPHVTGPLTGELIRLEPFQIFALVNLFALLVRETGLRKYREAFILLPRGNAKSTLAAIIGLYMTFCEGQGGAEGLSGATSLDQARAVFDPAKRMVEMTPALAAALGLEVAARSVFQPHTGSSLRPVRAQTKDGGLPWIAIADELHQAINGVQLAAFRTGMGKRRGSDPLLLIITTAGVNVAGVCRQEQLYFEGVLEGSIKDDSKFALIYTIDADDDWRDFRVWRKANPNYGVAVDEDHLRREYERALQSPAAQADCLTKYLNVWCNTAAGWLNQNDWSKAADANLVIPSDAPAWLAVDLSTKTDITAIALVANLPDGVRAIVPYLFLPTGALERSTKNAPAYKRWLDSGDLIATDGNASDHGAVEDKVRELCRDYNVQTILFDNWQAASMSQRLAADGLDVAEFPQRAQYLGPAMIDFEADLLNGKLRHPDNECLNWMASNISVQKRGAFQSPCKPTGQDHLKIDGMITALMAHATAVSDERVVETAPLQLIWLE